MYRADRGGVAGQQPGEPGLVQHVARDGGDIGLGRDLAGVAGDGGDGVAAAGEFG